MKNEYEVRGGTTAIFLSRKDGIRLETLIDTVDLELVNERFRSLYAHWSSDSHGFYAYGWLTTTPRKTAALARVIMAEPVGLMVDHIDHVTLDNRRSNLRIATRSENGMNRLGARRDNRASGLRGVRFSTGNSKRPWRAIFTFQGRSVYLGYFTTPEEASSVVNAKLFELTGISR